MKKLLILAGAGTATGLALALLFLVLEFGGVTETLTPYRPEGLGTPKAPPGQTAPATPPGGEEKGPDAAPPPGN